MLHSGELPPRVDVLECGYKWNGEVYPTLTHISWKATGYQIGGNTFFGLPVKRRGGKNRFSYDLIWLTMGEGGKQAAKY